MANDRVRVRQGVPVEGDFAGAPGTPLVVDEVTGRVYLLRQDGTISDLLLLSAEPVWEDLRFPASQIDPVGLVSDPDLDTDLTAFPGTLLFHPTIDNIIAGVAQMPHAWAEGTSIRPHVHWMKTTATAGSVDWDFRYRMMEPGAAAGVWSAWIPGIAAGINGTENAADTHYVDQFGLIDMTGFGDSAMLAWQIRRSASTDTYPDDARLLEFDIHYRINSLGSETEVPEV